MGRLSRHRTLRFVGWLAAYVLALHTMLLGLATVPSTLAGATGSIVAPLCLAHAPVGEADGPWSQYPTAQHCLGCFTAAAGLPPPGAVAAVGRYPTAPALAAPTARAATATTLAGWPGLPRAPPILA